jgi:hypothetical protein
VPAVKAFQRIVAAIDNGIDGLEDEAATRDLAYLSMARAFYSSSVRADDPQAPTFEPNGLSAALKYWMRIDISSEYLGDALFEQSWGWFLAGDYPHALGSLHAVQAPFFPRAIYPEADVLRALISFKLCQYDDAITIVARMKQKYEPIRRDLEAARARLTREAGETFQLLEAVQGKKADLPPAIRPIVERAFSDRALRRHVEYVRLIDAEKARFQQTPASFQSSPVGADAADAISLAREIAIQNAATLARERYQQALDDLDQHLRDASDIFIAAARRPGPLSSDGGSRTLGFPKVDERQQLWRFDGEYWRDEFARYRQVVTSKCRTDPFRYVDVAPRPPPRY